MEDEWATPTLVVSKAEIVRLRVEQTDQRWLFVDSSLIGKMGQILHLKVTRLKCRASAPVRWLASPRHDAGLQPVCFLLPFTSSTSATLPKSAQPKQAARRRFFRCGRFCTEKSTSQAGCRACCHKNTRGRLTGCMIADVMD